jgi:hypothetical protein
MRRELLFPSGPTCPPKDWPNTGILFWAYVTTVPLTLLALANLIAAWLDKSVRRKWWLSAVFIVLIERLTTFSYFIPAMLNLAASDLPMQRSREIIAMAFFQSRASSSYPHGLVADAQCIVGSNDNQV